MHVYDVEEAIGDADRIALQHAFRVLVAFPRLGHIEGTHSAVRLDQLFGDVISALQFDQATMPKPLLEALHVVTAVSFELDASYAEGATVASEFRERWQHLFTLETAKPQRNAA